jgi:hypothetical protein
MTMMFMVPKFKKKKPYHNPTNLIEFKEEPAKKRWQLYPLVAGLMMKKIASYKQQLIAALDSEG